MNLAIGVILLAFYVLIGFDMWYTSSQSANGYMNAINYGVCAAIGIIGAICTAYVVPLASRSSRPVSQQFRCSAALVAAHPIPALVVVALAAIPVAIAVWVPGGLFFVGFFWGCCSPDAAVGWVSWLCGVSAYSTTRLSPRMRRTTLSARRHQPPTPPQTNYANRLPSITSL
ncbi:hypothetical protein ACLUXI_06285 [Bifidobacterium apri]|uniref:hypothetical protein n=1 Tax=Bifidobacterium apri TaxID=1769423 RepID=UPI003992975C